MPGYKRAGAKKIGKTTATKGMPKKKKTKGKSKKYNK
jgi:hypothetical protein